MRLRRTSDPAELPVTLAEARAHLRVIDTAEDTMVSQFIAAATERLDGKDGMLGRALVTQSWELSIDRFPCDADTIQIPLPPLVSVESVTYLDADGATQTLATSVYLVDTASEPGVIALKAEQVWPTTLSQRNAVTIAFTAGYGAAADVPDRLKAAIKLYVGDLFANREAQGSELHRNAAADALAFPFKVF